MMEFKKVIAAAFYSVNQYRGALAKALAWPFVALVLIDAAEYLDLGTLSALFLWGLGGAIKVFFAITTHRIVLLGPDAVSKWGIISWSKRETFFLLHLIGLSLLVMPVMALGFIPVIGAVLAIIVLCWLTARLCLVFPGIAIDKGVFFGQSWELTKNHQLLMFLVVIVFPMLLIIPILISALLPYTFFVSSLISTFVIVFEVAALSMAYHFITTEAYQNGQAIT